MNTLKWNLTWRMILAAVIVTQSTLQAQTILTLPATGSAGNVNLQFRLDGSIIEEGSNTPLTLSNADLESASRFIWYPTQSALRAGGGLGTETVSQVGQYSVGLGYEVIASGYTSITLGYISTASSNSTTSIGSYDLASNPGATAIGCGATATGVDSIALGGTTTGYGSVNIGTGIAYADHSISIGCNNNASGNYSTAIGAHNICDGTYSTAMGCYTEALSYDSLVIGTYNLSLSETSAQPSYTAWVSTDPLFEIGNGTSYSAQSDALVVYKNGDAVLQGTLRVAPGGDIPMYNPNGN